MSRLSRFVLPVAALFISLSACTTKYERTLEEAQLLLDALEEELVPDRRLELWDLHLSLGDQEVQLKGELANQHLYEKVMQSMDQRFPELKKEVVLLPEHEPAMLVNGVANNSVIHLRREPSSATELVTQSLLGTPLRILKEQGGKSLVQLPDGYLGWVNTPEIQPLSAEELEAYRQAEKIIFTAQYGFAYSEADEGSLPVSDLVAGNMLALESAAKDFYRVRYPDGRKAYVKASEVRPAREVLFKQPIAEDLVRTALSYHGIPYLWGGTSSKNIDCSGLVSNVYFLNGIQLPRDADLQSRCGRELTVEWNWDDLLAGDLLFFGRKASAEEAERVTHVAMYMGEGEFIHSAGYRERVSINHMDSTESHFIDAYPGIFVRAVRILGEEGGDFRPVPENPYYKEIIRMDP